MTTSTNLCSTKGKIASMQFCLSSGYKTARRSLNLTPYTYSTTSSNVTVTHDENAVGLGKPKTKP